jgi:hypothetical protein
VIVTQGLQPEGEEGHLLKFPCNKYGAGVAKRGLPILYKDKAVVSKKVGKRR